MRENTFDKVMSALINPKTQDEQEVLNKIANEPLENKRYAIWNNKGGVGKTALTFVLATEYANKHPNQEVVVIDMCPQANISEIMLGGNGKGNANLEKLIKSGNTIGGYFTQRISKPHDKTGSESSFAIQVNKYNENLPQNLHIIAGDPILEKQVDTMTMLASVGMPRDAWKKIHSWVLDILEGVYVNKGNRAVFFIDCNPSFSIYTKQALVASNRLIIPCTADGSSARGVDNVASLVYGINNDFEKFSDKLELNNVSVPKIHLVPLNKSTQYDKDAAAAFQGMYNMVKERVIMLTQTQNQLFSENGFKNTFFDVMDMHSIFVVATHEGNPIYKLKSGYHDVHNERSQVNSKNVKNYHDIIEKLMYRF